MKANVEWNVIKAIKPTKTEPKRNWNNVIAIFNYLPFKIDCGSAFGSC